MSDASRLPPEQLLEELLTRFEDACRAGARPGLPEYYGRVVDFDDAATKARYLRELLILDLQYAIPVPDATQLAASVFREDRYECQTLHERGGQGEVWEAWDRELERTVAVKKLQPSQAENQQARRRFLREAQVAARLQHPGIAPIYGLQDSRQGCSFAMQFVSTGTLEKAIQEFHAAAKHLSEAERSRRLRDLLQRFISVCETIHYAHHNGVVHRDLKPRQVMVGEFGETLVIDWGLAKLLPAKSAADHDAGDQWATLPFTPIAGLDEEKTETGVALGTPAYMSPEQAAGANEAVGPASDIYCLGATLFHLLTSRPPHAAETGWESLELAKAGNVRFPKPRDFAPPKPLEAVCLKAMAHARQDRYATAKDLAEDVRQWLADEPVSVFPEPLPVRAWRWVRKHRTLVSTAAGILIVAVPLLLIGLGLLASANDAERAARGEADKKRKEAEEQRARADDNLQLAKEFIRRHDNVSTDLMGADLDLEQLVGIREKMDTEVLQDLGRIRKIDPNDALWRYCLAGANARLASLMAGRGKPVEAESFYIAAVKACDELMRASPDNLEYLDRQGTILNNYAIFQRSLGHQQEAIMTFARARETHKRTVDIQPTIANRYQFATASLNLGMMRAGVGALHDPREVKAGIVQVREAQQALKSLAEIDDMLAKYPDIIQNYAEACSNLSLVLDRENPQGNRAEVATLRGEAFRALQQLNAAYPRKPEYAEFLAQLSWSKAAVHLLERQYDEAARWTEKARLLLADLTTRFPADPRNWEHAAEVEIIEAEIAIARGEVALAREKFHAAQRISEQHLTGPYPNDMDFKQQRDRIEKRIAELQTAEASP